MGQGGVVRARSTRVCTIRGLDRNRVVIIVNHRIVHVKVAPVGVDAVRVEVLGLQHPCREQLDELVEDGVSPIL